MPPVIEIVYQRAFMVLVFYLWRRNKPIWFAALPMVVMLIMPAWAMLWNMFSASGWLAKDKLLLFYVGAAILGLQVWMIVEALLLLPRVKGILEEALPPLHRPAVTAAADGQSGPNC